MGRNRIEPKCSIHYVISSHTSGKTLGVKKYYVIKYGNTSIINKVKSQCHKIKFD